MHELVSRLYQGETPSLKEFVKSFGQDLSLLSQYEETQQDAEWHAEGNVFIHTQWVLDELYQILTHEAKHLPQEQKVALIIATALHDIGKPLVTKTKEIEGLLRTVAPHHEERGCSYLAYRLLEFDIPYSIVQQILRLVALHHKPRQLVVHNAEKREYCYLARHVNVELLYYLAKADILGRDCKEKQRQQDIIDLFKLFCVEYGLWGNQNPYEEMRKYFDRELINLSPASRDAVYGYGIHDFEAGLIFTPEEAVARRYPYLKLFPELVVMCGPSGSGKSRWIQNNLKEHNIISLDDLREEFGKHRGDQEQNSFILAKAKERLKEHLRHNDKVVWDATSLRKDFRKMVCQLGMDYHALVTIIVLHVPVSSYLSGNKTRETQVSQQVLDDQLKALEWVQDHEAHRIGFFNRDSCLEFRGQCSG